MPVIIEINGIKIHLYFNEHLPPHIHAVYAEHEVLLEIETREIHRERGKFPKKRLKAVKSFVQEHEQALLEKFYEFNPNLRKNENE